MKFSRQVSDEDCHVMNSKESLKPKVGAAVPRDGKPTRLNKSLPGKLGLTSPLARQFKSPFSRNQHKSAQTLTEPELKEKLSSTVSKIEEVDREIEELRASGFKESELQTHIDKLHEYNEIKDVGQMILGRIAVVEAVQTKDLYPKYGLALTD